MAWKQEVNLPRLIDVPVHPDLCLRHTLLGVTRKTPVECLSLATSSESSLLLRKTAVLLENHPKLSSCCIRRIWFDGYYKAESTAMIFGVLRQCKKLDDLSISWTALRYGTVADWSSLFGSNATGPRVTSLEIRATNVPERYLAMKKVNAFSNNALESTNVDFSNLACLRLCANSRYTSITNKDLIAIARTARNLRELHVNAVMLGAKGIRALIRSSQPSLEVLELDGSFQLESTQPEHRNSDSHLRFPRLVARCPRLRRLRLHSVRTCREIFTCGNIAWGGRVQTYLFQFLKSDEDTAVFFEILDQARYLMNSRMQPDENVDIEFFTSGSHHRFIFEPKCAQVHGNFSTNFTFREPWLIEKKKSTLGYMREYAFCINEDEFKEGLNKGYVWL